MKDNHISISEAKGRLGELVKRAAYGKEHFILEFRDKPQAAIVSLDYLEGELAAEVRKTAALTALENLKRIRDQTAAETGKMFDSVPVLRELRDERADHLASLSGRQRDHKTHGRRKRQ